MEAPAPLPGLGPGGGSWRRPGAPTTAQGVRTVATDRLPGTVALAAPVAPAVTG